MKALQKPVQKLVALVIAAGLIGIAGAAALFVSLSSSLPQIIKVSDYKPLLVSEVYARGGEKIGEYSQQYRKLTPIEKIPQRLIEAFIAIEDRQFYEHEGINYIAIARAMLTNVASGRTKQGASTITQQLAKQLFLSPERTYTRKIREALLAKKLEENLSKDEILYLYLNQIYFGSGAHGVEAAADIYFRKSLDKLTLGEMAIIAGLPQRPTDYSPIANPQLAKRRQRDVLNALVATGKITQEEADKAFAEPVTVYLKKEYKEIAPYVVETLRQMLVAKIGETTLLDEGVKVYTTIDFAQQQAAQENVRDGLRALDKRQGYRGALRRIENPDEQLKFLESIRDDLEDDIAPIRVVTPEGMVKKDHEPISFDKPFHKRDAKGAITGNLPPYAILGKTTEGLVTRVDDELGLVYVRFADVQALLDLSDMEWARKPDPSVNTDHRPNVTKPSVVLKQNDIILLKITGDRFASKRDDDLRTKIAALKKTNPRYSAPEFTQFAQVALEQEPNVQGALISFDLKSGETLAMVGGYNFKENEFNRALQAKRQTGSSFKSIVYAAALDKGFSPATPIQDAPIVYDTEAGSEGQDTDIKKWKPHNITGKFAGDILFRNALVKSLNIPTVKILEKIGVSWAIDYARRLGIFSPLNQDLSLGLGSSSITLYEMTRAFAQLGRLGKRLRPLILHKVVDREGKELVGELSLDTYFEKELGPIEKEYEDRRLAYLEERKQPAAAPTAAPSPAAGAERTFADDPSKRKTPMLYFDDPDQLISPQTAYVMTSLLAATITDENGTAIRARSLGRPAAGKTGSTNGYFDGWFVGFTPQIAAGVWVGFNEERSLGAGEGGSRTALPIWIDYMKTVYGEQPATSFPVPPGIVFANIDSQTGKLASASSRTVVNQAFVKGMEPGGELTMPPGQQQPDDTDFYKEDLTQ